MNRTKRVSYDHGVRVLLSIVAVVGMGCGATTPHVATLPAKPPTYEKTKCHQPLAPNSTTWCGYVTVPENRTKADSRPIKLYFTVYPVPDGSKPKTPKTNVIYLTGGPGSSTADSNTFFENPDNADNYRNNFAPERDLIVLDQRGTNYSQPALYCSKELGGLRAKAYGETLSDATKDRLDGLDLCYQRFKKDGIDLSSYNTNENAADVRDLALALGHRKVNIYGASYGTRLTMTVMKLFPEIVENVILDSVLPPEVNPFEQQPAGVTYALNALWNSARADFPKLAQMFYETIAKLEAQPVTVTAHHYGPDKKPIDKIDVKVDGVKYVSYVVGQLRLTPYDGSLPLSIATMAQTANYQQVADAYLSTIDFLFTTGEGGTSSVAIGMFESMNAADNGYYTSEDSITSYIEHYMQTDSVREWARQNFIFQNADILRRWKVDPLPREVMYPVTGNIPTLFLVGTLDSATPLPFSQPSSRYLPKSYFVEIVGGHAVAYLPCVTKAMKSFWENPKAEPSNSCDKQPTWAKPSPK